MSFSLRVILSVAGCAIVASSQAALGQQVTIEFPHHGWSRGGWEHIGHHGGLHSPYGHGGYAPPPFGGYDPHGGFSLGVGVGPYRPRQSRHWHGGAGGFQFETSTVPYLTVTPGVPGSFYAGRRVPMVVGSYPVIGVDPGFAPEFMPLGAANTVDGRMMRGEFHVRNGQVIPGPAPMEVPGRLPLNLPEPPPPDDLEIDLPPQPVRQALPRQREGLPGQPLPVVPAQPVPALPVVVPQVPAPAVEPVRPQGPLLVPPGNSATLPTVQNESTLRLWQQAQRLESEGKPGAARMLYQSALLSAEGSLKSDIEQRLAHLSN